MVCSFSMVMIERFEDGGAGSFCFSAVLLDAMEPLCAFPFGLKNG